MYVGRLAPSPTGRIHMGVARTLLAAWLDARAAGGRVLLRVEDIDGPRTVPGAAGWIREDLEWLGLDWDEESAQSAHDSRYLEALARLEAAGRLYPCTCTRKEIALASSAPHGEDGPRYPGTCRDGARPRPDRTPSLRLRTAPGDRVRHVDRLYGAVEQDVHAVVGDFVLRRSDGLWAYQLAVVADDLAQGVTTIVRGVDLLASTPRQLVLRRLLDPAAPPVETLHLPLVLGPGGQRLAKRDGAIAVADRRAAGSSAERILGILAESLGLATGPISARELIAAWDPARIPIVDRDLDAIEGRSA